LGQIDQIKELCDSRSRFCGLSLFLALSLSLSLLSPSFSFFLSLALSLGHKNTKVLLILKVQEIILLFGAKHIKGHFLGFFKQTSTFLNPEIALRYTQDNLGVKKGLEKSLKIPHYMFNEFNY
jgi:hypothetical protein